MSRPEERRYRARMAREGLVAFRAAVEQSDLWCLAREDLGACARELLISLRGQVKGYIARHPDFLSALAPWPKEDPAPPVVRAMILAGRAAGVGPMAAVAGALAEAVGRGLLPRSPEVVVENGGDVFLRLEGPATIAVQAGASPLSGKIGLRFDGGGEPFGVCASSGTVGHSLSLGKADAAVVVARDCALADAAATAVGNRVVSAKHVKEAVAFGAGIPGVLGVLVVAGETLGAWGEAEVTPL
jgi:ApbE superfamily uncharacterized protein (UPF0280 family)